MKAAANETWLDSSQNFVSLLWMDPSRTETGCVA